LKNNLDARLLNFLSNAKVPSTKLLALESDASKRNYYRSKIKKKKFLIMDSSYEKNSLKSFVKISDWLSKKGYSTPDIFYKELSKGFCMIEDFGDSKFSTLKNKDMKEKYELTIQLLRSLSKKKPPNFLSKYSKFIFKQELNLFIDWYLFYNKNKARKAISLWNEIWDSLFCKVDNYNKKAVVLRDFHVDNLFWLRNRDGIKKIGLIDFQDAVIGHPCYDLVSLLQDVRVNITDKERCRLYNYYMYENKIDHKLFEESYFIFGTQRLIKIIGIFYRLKLLHKKENYIKFIPRTWELLKKNINYPQLKDLNDWFNKYVF
tara:strand:+ start:3672 stop:4625 length:954 start_codon:yes stop_codon:yes gene_type:complete